MACCNSGRQRSVSDLLMTETSPCPVPPER
jgi:hypothetical protein